MLFSQFLFYFLCLTFFVFFQLTLMSNKYFYCYSRIPQGLWIFLIFVMRPQIVRNLWLHLLCCKKRTSKRKGEITTSSTGRSTTKSTSVGWRSRITTVSRSVSDAIMGRKYRRKYSLDHPQT